MFRNERDILFFIKEREIEARIQGRKEGLEEARAEGLKEGRL